MPSHQPQKRGRFAALRSAPRLIAVCAACSTVVCFAEPWRRHTIDNSSKGADGVRLADVNGDGRMDIATGWEEGGIVRVYVNPGPAAVRNRWPAVTVGRVQSPEDAVLVDLDADGRTDVVSCCEGKTRSLFVHWAPQPLARYLLEEAWKTEVVPVTSRKQMWMYCLPMQIDDRHGVDLVVGAKGNGATVGWLASPANPRRLADWTFQPLYKAGWIMSLRAVDMDLDNDPDILLSDRKGATRGILWLDNPGRTVATDGAAWREHRWLGTEFEVMFLDRGNVVADQRREVVAAVRGRGIMIVQEAGQVMNIPMPDNCGTAKSVAVGDIDLDGDADIVFTCENAVNGRSGARWLKKGTSDTVWTDHEISGPEGIKFDRVELLDMDNDGDLDALTCEERENLGVIWYENPTSGR